jgi:putative hemolysin
MQGTTQKEARTSPSRWRRSPDLSHSEPFEPLKENTMKELPSPTFPFSPLALPKGLMQRIQPRHAAAIQVPTPQPGRAELIVSWAKHNDEVRLAQRLRYKVFAEEMGARLDTKIPGHDVDLFDNFCEHLLVRDADTRKVVGTYRVLTPAQAKRVGSTYSDLEFDLTRLRSLRERMVELGRSCVHKDYRHGGVIMALWGALAEFMSRNQLDTMIGCASIPMLHNGIVSGDAAASIWHQLKQTHLAPIEHHVRPRLPLPVDQLDGSLQVSPPALIKGYLRLGAKILGAPAWDPDFNSADLPMMLRIPDLPPRYRKHFLGA